MRREILVIASVTVGGMGALAGCASTSEAGDAPATASDAPASDGPTSDAPAAAPAVALDEAAVVEAKIASGAAVVDVRPAARRDAAPVEGVAAIPFDEVGARVGELDALTGGDRTKPVVLFCGNGSKAVKAREALAAQGFTDVTVQTTAVVAGALDRGDAASPDVAE